MPIKSPKEWLADQLARRGRGSRKDLAAFLGVRRDAITRMLQDQPGKEPRDISGEELLKMAEFFGEPPPSSVMPGGISVPVISWISAGEMACEETPDEAIGTILVTDLPPGDYFALIVTGTSMNKISPPDSRIIVNRKDRRLVPNACYVVGDHDGSASYKRYRPDPMRFEPVSYEDGHEAIYPDNEPLIVGRVVRSIIDM